MRIDEKLYRETGSRDTPLEGKQMWQRMDCPFCGHKRAVISYGANWFQCWACGEKRSGYTDDPDSLAIARYGRQIDKAAWKVRVDFGEWLEHWPEEDIICVARELVFNYAEGEKGTGKDAGMLAIWETDYNIDDEPWRVEGKVQSVLDRDMIDWARGIKRWEEHNRNDVAGDVGLEGKYDSDTDERDWRTKLHEGDFSDYKTPDTRPFIPTGGGVGRRLRNKQASLAVRFGIKYSYFHSKEPPGTDLLNEFKPGSLKRCDLMRNGVGPIAGHCRWCDKSLGRPATCPKEDTDILRDEHDWMHEWFPILAATTIDNYTLAEVAEMRGMSVRTVERRLQTEKLKLERQKDLLLV